MASILLWPTVLMGFFAAMYTAFLFGQCEGRDLWQTPLLPRAFDRAGSLCGSAVLMFLPPAWDGSPQLVFIAERTLVAGIMLHLLMLLGEVAMPHTTDNSRYAARLITHGPFSRAFWGGAVLCGGLLPVVMLLLAGSNRGIAALAAALALAGLSIFEWCFVMAGQSVPNS